MNRKGCFKLIAISCLLLAVVFQFTGCASTTPQGRASENPQILQSLSPTDRDLVLKGQIREGMTRDAVFLAWGKADQVTTGSENGRPVETWRYTTLRPVYYTGPLSPLPGYYAYPYGYRRARYVYPYPGYGMTPDYVSTTSAVVRFRSGSVVAWETVGR